MIATKLRNLLVLSIMLLVTIATVSAINARPVITRAKLYASGGSLEVNDDSFEDANNLLRVSVVKRGDICDSYLYLSVKAGDKSKKVFLKARLRMRDGCDITQNGIELEGRAAISYRKIPRVVRRPLVSSNGHIYWIRDVLGKSERVSKLTQLELRYEDNKMSLCSKDDFFCLEDIPIDRYEFKEY